MPDVVLSAVPIEAEDERDLLWRRRLPDSEKAFTLCQISQIVDVPYDIVRRAELALSYRASTKEVMRPLDNSTPRHFSPLAARLIARHICAPVARPERTERKGQARRRTNTRNTPPTNA